MSDVSLDLAGESMVLLPERALFWERLATLLVADVHWGKAEAFRAAALPVPTGTTEEGLARLDRALDRTAARRLVVLGDLFHSRHGCTPELFATIGEWRRRRSTLEILLIRGNHDRGAGDPPLAWNFVCVGEPHLDGPFAFCHHPQDVTGAYALAGHLHPAVGLSGVGRQRATPPCFVFGPDLGILPAFGGFTGTAKVRPTAGDRVFVIADEEVIRVR